MRVRNQPIPWSSLPFLRLTFFFILGILFRIYQPVIISKPFWLLACTILSYVAFVWLSPKKVKRLFKASFGLLAFAILMTFGYCLTELKTENIKASHISTFSGTTAYKAQITSAIKEKTKSLSARLTVISVCEDSIWREASGQVLAYFSKSDTNYQPNYGDILLLKGKPMEVNAPQNPNEFNYRRYLTFNQIFNQHFLKSNDFCHIEPTKANRLIQLSLNIRTWADGVFKQYLPSDESYGIASALILGIKDHLDDSIKTAYSSAGAMHVLAVSGLHVGIIFKLLAFLLSGLKKRKWGNLLFTILNLAGLWFYAMITGFSPSVLRAVTMFSFLIVGQSFRKQTNIYNTLALSAFTLLCWDPYLIMGVGFQLSYVAVLGIVFLQPKLAQLWHIENPIGKFIWDITTVSIAAQIATFPIGLLYFHQFPTYFWISNFFVIPAAGLILQSGLLLLGLSYLNHWLATQLGFLIDRLIWGLNQVVYAIQDLPNALIHQIDISILETWLIYFIIISILFIFISHKMRFVYIAIAFSSFLFLIQFNEYQEQSHQKFISCYRINHQPNLCLINGNQAIFLADSSLLAQHDKLTFHVNHHLWALGATAIQWVDWNRINKNSALSIQDIHQNKLVIWEGKRILYYQKPVKDLEIKVDYLIVGKNSLVSWDNMPKIQATIVVLDASNSYRTVNKLVENFDRNAFEIHDAKNNGAFLKHFQ